MKNDKDKLPPLEERILFWDKKFGTKEHFTPEQLLFSFKLQFGKDISERSMKGDFAELQNRGAPLENKRFGLREEGLNKDQKSHYFYNTYFSLPKVTSESQPSLLPNEIERIEQAIAILKEFNHLPQFDDLKSVLLKLNIEVGKKDQKVVDFEQITSLKGLHHLERLYKAIVEQKVLNLSYEAFDKPPIEVLLHPYFLKQFNNRWYVYGFDSDSGGHFSLCLRPY